MEFRGSSFAGFAAVSWILIQLAASTPVQAQMNGSRRAVVAETSSWSSFLSDLRVGFLTGPTLSNYSVAPIDPKRGSVLGFAAGFFAELPTGNPHFTVAPGIVFSQKGYKYQDRLTGAARVEDRLSVTQLELPLHARGNVLFSEIFVPYFFAGPAFMYKVAASQSREDAQGRALSESTPQIKSLALALDMGTGFDFRLTKTLNVLGQFRFSLGMTDESSVAGVSSRYRGAQFLTGVSTSL